MIERGAPAPPYLAQPEFLTFSAARWKRDTIRWYYNPAYSPIAASTVVAVAQASFAKWSAVCNVNFAYGGITATPPHATDGLVVIGWSTVLGSSSGGTWLDIVADRIVDADIGLHPQQAGGVAPLDSLLVHEIGHVLGLDHSDVPGAVMSGPPYTPYVSWADMRTLKADDITGCQALYGPAPGVVATNPPAPPVCTINVFDSSPAVGSALAVAAQCSGMPYRYLWTGCTQANDRYCIDESTTAGVRTYSVVATNAGGNSGAVNAAVTWVDTLPRCTLVQQGASGSPTTAQAVQLFAQCSNAPTRYRWLGCGSTGSTCTTTQSVSGPATYTVVAGNAAGDGPPASIMLDWQPGVAPAPCAGFADVAPNTPFCSDVAWMANRAVTNGCAAGSYCGGATVSRMQMALFLSRLGAAMTPAVLRAEIASATFGQGQVVCQTPDHAVGASARSALVRTRITARTASGASVVRSSAVMSVDSGQTWSSLTLDGGAVAEFPAARAATLTDYAAVHLSPGQHVRFGIALGGTAFSLQGACSLSAELVNRDRDAAPF